MISRRLKDDGARLHHETFAREYEVALSLPDGDEQETWIYIGSGPDEYLEVRLQDVPALMKAVTATLSDAAR